MNFKKALFVRFLSIISAFILVLTMLPQMTFAIAYDPEENFQELELRFWEDEQPEIGFYINASSRYILETVTEPKMGSTFGEWSVMDLLRGMYTGHDYINYIPENYFEDYLGRIEEYVEGKKGNLDRNKSTEWSRLILALSSLDYDITDVAGYDFIERLSESNKFSYRQGINGPIWEIIAMNTGGYEFYKDDQNDDVNTFGKMIDYILNLERTQTDGVVGGWSLMGNNPDPDITGMALQALAPYYLDKAKYNKIGAETSYEEFAKAVERAIYVLSLIQQKNGSYAALGNTNSESTVQVIVALTALSIDPLQEKIELKHINKDINFITEGALRDGVHTNNMINALLTFWAKGSGSSPEVGGFKHITTGYDGGGGSGTGVNDMATDQALYGLIAYDRFKKGENPLYDMTDMKGKKYKELTAKTYTAGFDGNLGEEVEQGSYSPYRTIKIPEGNLTEGRNFKNWTTKSGGGGAIYDPGEKLVMPEQDITLYAQYEKIEYKLNLEMNGGIFLGEEIPKVYTVEDRDILLPTIEQMEYEDSYFMGWYDNKGFEREAIQAIISGSYGDKTLYAKWVEATVMIKEVESLIDLLPELEDVTLKNNKEVEEAREMYNRLTTTDQERISNADKLDSLVVKLQEMPDKLEAQRVEDLITALPEVSVIELEHREKVNDARNAYEGLTPMQKELVGNIDKLIALELELKDIPDQEEAEKVKGQIDALPNASVVKLKDKEKVETARKAYKALSEVQKKLVTNEKKLIELELKIKELEESGKEEKPAEEAAQQVVDLINKLPKEPDVTLKDKAKIEKVGKAYENLSTAQRKLVTNVDKLKELQNKIKKLEEETGPESPEKVDNSKLAEVILKGQKAEQKDKTKESIGDLEKAIKSGESVIADKKSTQKEIDNAIEEIELAIQNLKSNESTKNPTNKVEAPKEIVKNQSGGTGNSGERLPKTATNTLNFLVIGLVFMLVGGTINFNRRKKVDVK